eukprot:GHUV01025221.1.p1 GENE.GHUV01025221.1~~GHUV01025221.1.p1  ORF type:complete len:196 (+),score=50.84 GHUV01025221.1:403-990(+)
MPAGRNLGHVCCTAACLLFVGQFRSAVAATVPEASSLKLQPQATQHSVPAFYCPDGGSMEGGLCYKRCKPGYKPLACTCFRGFRSYIRGCGTRPLVCQAMSYRRQKLPPVTSRHPFSLVISADPQLFRVVDKYKEVKKATHYNIQLVQSIDKVTQLGQWTWEAGGGKVQEPRALVVLGDMTEVRVCLYRQGLGPS